MLTRAPLIRRTSLPRATRASRALARLMLKRRHELLERSHGHCERCGTALTVTTMDPSHRKRRREGDHRLCALTASCRPCHDFMELHPLIAMQEGFKVPFAADPASVPVRIWGLGWRLLTADGSYREVTA